MLAVLISVISLFCSGISTQPQLVTETFDIGPFLVKPGVSDNFHPGKRPALGNRIDLQYWGDFKLVNTFTGKEYSSQKVMLHHAVFAREASPEHPLIAAGMETTLWDGNSDQPDGKGFAYPYRVILGPEENPVLITLKLVNHMKSIQIVSLRYTMRYSVHDHKSLPIRPIYGLFRQNNGSVPGIQGSADSISHEVYEFHDRIVFPQDAVILRASTHLHQGGFNITVRDDSTSEVICVSKAKYGTMMCTHLCDDFCPYTGAWTVLTEMTDCAMEHPVKAGESVSLTSVYDKTCSWENVMSYLVILYWDGTET